MALSPRPSSHRPVPQRLTFLRPLSPSAAVRPPKGDDWLHEPKWDGFCFQIIKDGNRVRFYSRHGAEYTDRLPGMVEAFGKLPTQSAILDGEFVLIDPRGAAHFYRLMAQMRTSHPDESQLMFMAFDLLHQDGVDLRALPLSERKRDLHRLCRNRGCRSCARCKPSRTAHCYSITATSLALRVSCPSAWRRATREGRAAIGSSRSARVGSASMPSAIACLRVRRASPS